jgi:dTDP-4-dehydrorhamnose reductase
LTEIKRVLITGASGQLGRELTRTTPCGYELHALSHQDFDISDRSAVAKWIETYRPELVVNAAGYTAVDRAESDRDKAFRANTFAPGYVAEALAQFGGRLIHISTDFVFDGSQGRPYKPDDPPRPLNVYGESKLGGERRVLEALGSRALVMRTSWLYSSYGNNFVHTMVRLMRERDEIRVVGDQIGTPTWARGLAQAIWAAAARDRLSGVYHWTDAGVAGWYDFAVAIQEEALARLLVPRAVSVVPISTEDFPSAAVRPSYSVLDKHETWSALGYTPNHWREVLRMVMEEMVREQ